MISQLSDKIKELVDEGLIDGKDYTDVATRLNLSRFTVIQYASGKCKFIKTAQDIYSEFKRLADERTTLVEKKEVLDDYTNQD